jgi:hypothetical protein
MIQIDDWYEILVAGLVILAALGLVLMFLRWFLGRGGRIKGPGFEASEPSTDEQDTAPPIVVEDQGAVLKRLETGLSAVTKKLEEMDAERQAARESGVEANQTMHKMIRKIMISQDAVIDALQSASIGNGNLTKARRVLAECGDMREEYLIDQLGAGG